MNATRCYMGGNFLGICLALSKIYFQYDLSLRITLRDLIVPKSFLPDLKDVTTFTSSSPNLLQIFLKSCSSACLFTTAFSAVFSGRLKIVKFSSRLLSSIVLYCKDYAIFGTPRFNLRVQVSHHHSPVTGLMPATHPL